MKIRTFGAEIFQGRRTDGRTNMTRPIVAFRNFANAPKHTNYKHKTHKKKNKTFWCIQNLRSFQRRTMQKFWIFFILIIITINMKQFWLIFHGRF